MDRRGKRSPASSSTSGGASRSATSFASSSDASTRGAATSGGDTAAAGSSSSPVIGKSSLRKTPAQTTPFTYLGGSSPTKNRLSGVSFGEKPGYDVRHPMAEGSRIVNLRLMQESLGPHLRCPGCRHHGSLQLSRTREMELSKGVSGTLVWVCRDCEEELHVEPASKVERTELYSAKGPTW